MLSATFREADGSEIRKRSRLPSRYEGRNVRSRNISKACLARARRSNVRLILRRLEKAQSVEEAQQAGAAASQVNYSRVFVQASHDLAQCDMINIFLRHFVQRQSLALQCHYSLANILQLPKGPNHSYALPRQRSSRRAAIVCATSKHSA
jgi:hypothetical protein